MPRRVLVLVSLLALGVAAFSGFVLEAGVNEVRLISSGGRRELEPAELLGQAGWVSTYGCMRHDLAVVVAADGVFRLGTRARTDEEAAKDRVFTPLAAREDCDEDKPPRAIYALVENDASLGDTLTHAYRAKVAPPPVAAIVTGVIGYGVGHARDAKAARAQLAQALGVGLDDRPLFVKGRQPGVLWVSVLTALAGLHGFVFAGLAVWWMRRRLRGDLKAHLNEEEDRFFSTDTLED